MSSVDVCLIGAGGVVGSAIVRRLALGGKRVVALEKHLTPAQETSGASSGVIHSGFHEVGGTLKAELACEGSAMLTTYAAQRGVGLLRCGMLIAIPHNIFAGSWDQAASLWRLWKSGKSRRIEYRWILTRAGIQKIAPIEAAAGIFIPSVCVIDVPSLIAAFQEEAVEAGAEILYGQTVRDIQVVDGTYVISTDRDVFRAPVLVNSAGLSAPDVSQVAGGPRYPLELIRGEYYELQGGMGRWGIRTLVYPAMPARSPSKGIHFGPRPDGRLLLGPNAVPPSSDISAKDVFLQAARQFVPQVEDNDLTWSHAGIRPKFVHPDGVSDFLIRLESEQPQLLNLIGIDSPGLSSCMAIARRVTSLLQWESNPERRLAG